MQKQKPLRLRRASEVDAKFLWELANDSEVREASFSANPISWENHISWLKSKLSDELCVFFVAIGNDALPVGQIRYDISNNEAIVSVSIVKGFRNKGYGTRIVSSSAQRLFKIKEIDLVHAYVKPENKASLSTFLKANFKDVGIASVNSHQAIHLVLSRGNTK